MSSSNVILIIPGSRGRSNRHHRHDVSYTSSNHPFTMESLTSGSSSSSSASNGHQQNKKTSAFSMQDGATTATGVKSNSLNRQSNIHHDGSQDSLAFTTLYPEIKRNEQMVTGNRGTCSTSLHNDDAATFKVNGQNAHDRSKPQSWRKVISRVDRKRAAANSTRPSEARTLNQTPSFDSSARIEETNSDYFSPRCSNPSPVDSQRYDDLNDVPRRISHPSTPRSSLCKSIEKMITKIQSIIEESSFEGDVNDRDKDCSVEVEAVPPNMSEHKSRVQRSRSDAQCLKPASKDSPAHASVQKPEKESIKKTSLSLNQRPRNCMETREYQIPNHYKRPGDLNEGNVKVNEKANLFCAPTDDMVDRNEQWLTNKNNGYQNRCCASAQQHSDCSAQCASSQSLEHNIQSARLSGLESEFRRIGEIIKRKASRPNITIAICSVPSNDSIGSDVILRGRKLWKKDLYSDEELEFCESSNGIENNSVQSLNLSLKSLNSCSTGSEECCGETEHSIRTTFDIPVTLSHEHDAGIRHKQLQMSVENLDKKCQLSSSTNLGQMKSLVDNAVLKHMNEKLRTTLSEANNLALKKLSALIAKSIAGCTKKAFKAALKLQVNGMHKPVTDRSPKQNAMKPQVTGTHRSVTGRMQKYSSKSRIPLPRQRLTQVCKTAYIPSKEAQFCRSHCFPLCDCPSQDSGFDQALEPATIYCEPVSVCSLQKNNEIQKLDPATQVVKRNSQLQSKLLQCSQMKPKTSVSSSTICTHVCVHNGSSVLESNTVKQVGKTKQPSKPTTKINNAPADSLSVKLECIPKKYGSATLMAESSVKYEGNSPNGARKPYFVRSPEFAVNSFSMPNLDHPVLQIGQEIKAELQGQKARDVLDEKSVKDESIPQTNYLEEYADSKVLEIMTVLSTDRCRTPGELAEVEDAIMSRNDYQVVTQKSLLSLETSWHTMEECQPAIEKSLPSVEDHLPNTDEFPANCTNMPKLRKPLPHYKTRKQSSSLHENVTPEFLKKCGRMPPRYLIMTNRMMLLKSKGRVPCEKSKRFILNKQRAKSCQFNGDTSCKFSRMELSKACSRIESLVNASPMICVVEHPQTVLTTEVTDQIGSPEKRIASIGRKLAYKCKSASTVEQRRAIAVQTSETLICINASSINANIKPEPNPSREDTNRSNAASTSGSNLAHASSSFSNTGCCSLQNTNADSIEKSTVLSWHSAVVSESARSDHLSFSLREFAVMNASYNRLVEKLKMDIENTKKTEENDQCKPKTDDSCSLIGHAKRLLWWITRRKLQETKSCSNTHMIALLSDVMEG